MGNQQDYGMRMYDARLGRFLSVDPLSREFASLSPYQYAMNTPIQAIDLDGAEAKLSNEDLGKVIAITTVMTVWEIRNSLTNSFLRANSDVEAALRIRQFKKIGITDPEIIKNYQLRMRTVVVSEQEKFCICPAGIEIERTYRREAVLEPKNSLGEEMIQAGLDVLSIGSTLLLAKIGNLNSPVLFAKGSGAIVMGLWRTSMSILYNVRRLSTIGENTKELKGIHSLDNVMEAGMAFVGPNAKEVYAPGGRFIGWESSNGLKRFRPPVYKTEMGKIQANFEQRTSTDIRWDNKSDQASRSNMHVVTDKGFDYKSKRKQPSQQNSGTD